MGKYINWVDDGKTLKLLCTHPLVERVWQTGGDTRLYESDPPEYRMWLNMELKNGDRFIGMVRDNDNFKTVISKAEDFLNQQQ
jgi:hypothetical protein